MPSQAGWGSQPRIPALVLGVGSLSIMSKSEIPLSLQPHWGLTQQLRVCPHALVTDFLHTTTKNVHGFHSLPSVVSLLGFADSGADGGRQ